MFCIKCGTLLGEGDAFCTKCGTPVSESLGNKVMEENVQEAKAIENEMQADVQTSGMQDSVKTDENAVVQQPVYGNMQQQSVYNEMQQPVYNDMQQSAYNNMQQPAYNNNMQQGYANQMGINVTPVNNSAVQIPSEYTPISAWGYVGWKILFLIPVVGFILLIVFACGGTSRVPLKKFARSYFCEMLIGVIITIIVLLFAVLLGMAF